MSSKLENLVISGMRDKKAEEITLLDFAQIPNAFTSKMIIATATSFIQAEAIAEEILRLVKKDHHIAPYGKEGFETKDWIIIDYVDVVVHIFLKKIRERYALEDYWGDAKIEKIEN